MRIRRGFSEAAARAGVGMVMTAHAIYDAMDPELPATFSRPIVTRLLKERFGYAVKELDKPLTKRAVLKTRYRPERSGGGVLLNGYLAFGDGTKDERLVKCGVRVQSRQLQIVQGPRKGGKSRAAQAKLGKDRAVDLTVTVDLRDRKVTLEAAGKTLTVDLELDMKSVTHAGFAVDGAFSAFSPVEVEGE